MWNLKLSKWVLLVIKAAEFFSRYPISSVNQIIRFDSSTETQSVKMTNSGSDRESCLDSFDRNYANWYQKQKYIAHFKKFARLLSVVILIKRSLGCCRDVHISPILVCFCSKSFSIEKLVKFLFWVCFLKWCFDISEHFRLDWLETENAGFSSEISSKYPNFGKTSNAILGKYSD